MFILVFFLLRQRLAPAPGALFLSHLALYSLGRFPIEGLRLDGEMLGPFKTARVMASGSLLVASVGLPWLWFRRERETRRASVDPHLHREEH